MYNLSILKLFILTTIGTAQAQVAFSGRIADPQGAVIPGAKVSAYSNGSQTPASVLSDSFGAFRFGSMATGSLLIQVEAPGFRSAYRSVRLEAAREENFQLEVSGLSGSVVVLPW